MEANHIICARLGDPALMPIEGAVTRVCETCGNRVSVSPTSIKRMATMALTIICVQCIRAQRDAGRTVTTLPPEPDQLEEIARNKKE